MISITSLCSAIADSSCLTWCECVWTQKADNFNRFFQPTSGDLLFQILPTWGNVLCNFQPTGNIWKEADAWQVPSSHLKSKKKCQRHNSTQAMSAETQQRTCVEIDLQILEETTNLAQASNSHFQKITKVWVWNLTKTQTSKNWPNFRFKISRSFIFSKHGHMDQARKWSIRPGPDERNEIYQTGMISDFRGRIWDVAKLEKLEKLPPWF